MATAQPNATRTLFNDPTFSDIKIKQICNGQVKEYFAHKAILCSHSKWFMNALTGNFKEASQDTIVIHDDDPKLFEMMLRSFYNEQLDALLAIVHERTLFGYCLVALKFFAVADKYACDEIAKQAVKIFADEADGFSNNEWIELVKVHYGSCPKTDCNMGRAIASELVICGPRDLIREDHEFYELTLKHHELASDLFQEFWNKDSLA